MPCVGLVSVLEVFPRVAVVAAPHRLDRNAVAVGEHVPFVRCSAIGRVERFRGADPRKNRVIGAREARERKARAVHHEPEVERRSADRERRGLLREHEGLLFRRRGLRHLAVEMSRLGAAGVLHRVHHQGAVADRPRLPLAAWLRHVRVGLEVVTEQDPGRTIRVTVPPPVPPALPVPLPPAVPPPAPPIVPPAADPPRPVMGCRPCRPKRRRCQSRRTRPFPFRADQHWGCFRPCSRRWPGCCRRCPMFQRRRPRCRQSTASRSRRAGTRARQRQRQQPPANHRHRADVHRDHPCAN